MKDLKVKTALKIGTTSGIWKVIAFGFSEKSH